MRLCLAILMALTLAAAENEPEKKSRATQLTEINSKLAELQRQIDYWQEKKRRLLDEPNVPPDAKTGEKQILTGPRNGKYHYTPSGHKSYERK